MEVKSKLTLEQQIEVLENIDWDDMIGNSYGLCGGIKISLFKVMGIQINLLNEIKECIPIFIRENAFPFKASEWDSSWWRHTDFGYAQRRKFVNWMIENIELQIIERDKKKMKKFFKDFIYVLTIFGIVFAVTMFMIYFKK